MPPAVPEKACRTFGRALVLGLGLLLACCSKRPDSSKGGSAVDGSAHTAGDRSVSGAPPLCSATPEHGEFAIGPVDEAPSDELPEDVPFGVTVGNAVTWSRGFAVSAVEDRTKGAVALVALVGPNAESGRLVELGKVYGDPDPPELAVAGDGLLLAVVGMDTQGRRLRLARMSDAGSASVEWLGEISLAADESAAVGLAAAEKRALLTWILPDPESKHARVRVMAFDPRAADCKFKGLPISAADRDAEDPAVVARPDGFWVAFVERGTSSRKTDAKPDSPPEDDGPSWRALDLDRGELMVVALDAKGRAVRPSIKAGPVSSHVVSFDLAALEDGSALIAFRDNDAALGAASTGVTLIRVGSDASVERRTVPDSEVGLGSPTLLVDRDAPAANRVWVAIHGQSDQLQFGNVGLDGKLIGPLRAEAELANAEPLLRAGSGLLVGRPRGRSVELKWMACRAIEAAPHNPRSKP